MEDLNTAEPIQEEKKEKDAINPSDYKLIINMIKEVDEQYQTLKNSLENTVINTYGLKPEVLDMILPYEKGSIPTLEPETIRTFLTKYEVENSNKYHDMSDNDLVETMKIVKDASLTLLSTKAEADNIKKESNDVLKEYFSYMTSDKVKESRLKRLDSLKEALKIESDPIAVKKMQHMIDTMEASLNFSFLYERFEKYGQKEIDNIKDAFFNSKRGSYIIKRYIDKISHFGYKEYLYKYFFNIEENFLGETYSPFNNLFLFIYMRMVAYADISSKDDTILVQAVTGALANLVYHKFNSTENEQYFLEVVTKILDKFMDYSDYFKENNTTYENHPARKKAEKQHEINRKESIIRTLNNLNISGYDENASADDLQNYLNSNIEKMETAQAEKKESIEENTSEEDTSVDDCIDENGVTQLTPKINTDITEETEGSTPVEDTNSVSSESAGSDC